MGQSQFPFGIFGLTVSPSGGALALVESASNNAPRVIRIARVQNGHVVRTGLIHPLATNHTLPTILSTFALTSDQAWSNHNQLLTYSDDAMTSRGGGAGTVWRENVRDGSRFRVASGQWAALQPNGPAVPLARTAGTCPTGPAAINGRSLGMSAGDVVKQTVGLYMAVRQQALRLADGSCLAVTAEGNVLKAERQFVQSLSSKGEKAAIPSTIVSRQVTINTARTATELATVTLGETVYRNGKVVLVEPPHTAVQRFTLHERYFGKPHGFPENHWIVGSVQTVQG
jgi:hypothetical protein